MLEEHLELHPEIDQDPGIPQTQVRGDRMNITMGDGGVDVKEHLSFQNSTSSMSLCG